MNITRVTNYSQKKANFFFGVFWLLYCTELLPEPQIFDTKLIQTIHLLLCLGVRMCKTSAHQEYECLLYYCIKLFLNYNQIIPESQIFDAKPTQASYSFVVMLTSQDLQSFMGKF